MLSDLKRLAIMSSKGRADPSGNIARRPSRDYSHTPLNEVTLIPFRHRRSASFGYTSIRMNPQWSAEAPEGCGIRARVCPALFREAPNKRDDVRALLVLKRIICGTLH